MRQGFTLIEVVVSAVLIAVIGVSLIKLSTSNIEGVEYSREKRYDLFSLVLYKVSKLGHINDYSKIPDIKIPNWKVDTSEEDVLTKEYDLTEDTNKTISVNIYKERIVMDGDGVDFFRLK